MGGPRKVVVQVTTTVSPYNFGRVLNVQEVEKRKRAEVLRMLLEKGLDAYEREQRDKQHTKG